MIITKEHQEAWVNTYIKEKHNSDECIGFIDGVNKTLEFVKNNLTETTAIHSLPLQEFITEIEHMQELYRNKRYTQAEKKRDVLSKKLDDLMQLPI